ncbi:hypothetical protein Tco_0233247 [Tanacetum coccineum]
MSATANTTPIVTTVTKATNKEKTPKEADDAPRVNILDFCEEHYEDILPVIMDKIRRDKRKEVHTRLDFEENTKKSRRIKEGSQNLSVETLSARYRNLSERPKMRELLKNNDGNVFGRLGYRRERTFERLSDTYSPSTTKSGPDRANSRARSHSRGRPHRRDSSSRDHPRSRDRSRGVEESYGNTCSSYGTGARHGYHSCDRDRSRSMKKGRPTDEEDLAVHWTCEEVDPFTPRIRNFKSSRKTRMPNNVKTYDRTGDLEDHVKIFQAATQQKKYVKDLVEIHNIKQRDEETIEDFMERFKVETGRMKGAPECMTCPSGMFQSGNLTSKVSQGKDGGLAGLPPYKNTKRNPRGRSRKVQTTTTHGNPGREEKQQQVLRLPQ